MQQLAADVDVDESVMVATPGLEGATVDPTTAQVAYEGRVVPAGQMTVEFAADGTSASVTNKSQVGWEQGDSLYLYVEAQTATAGDVQALVDQVNKNTQDIADLQAAPPSGGGVGEAPQDGDLYARSNSQWLPVRPPLPDQTNTYGLTAAGARSTKVVDLQWSQAIPTSGGTVVGPLTVNGSMTVDGDFTMTGPWLVLSETNTPAAIFLSGGAGNYAAVIGQTAGVDRWRVYMGDYHPEQGNNTGSDFRLMGFDDGGASLGEWLHIERATGRSHFATDVAIGGDLQVQTINGNPAVAVFERLANLEKEVQELRNKRK
jgi:hypothetical protein